MIRRAFTLIELLVVIAIIAILAAILFPVFAQAKAAAKKTADTSNQKQIDLAVIQYVTDNDDHYPLMMGFSPTLGRVAWNFNQYFPITYPIGPGTDGSYAIRMESGPACWVNSTQPYTKNKGVLETPGAPVVSAGGASNAAYGTTDTRGISGNEYNGLLSSYNASGVAQPADIIMNWTGRGFANTNGAVLSNPALVCSTNNPIIPCQYIARTSVGCASGDGGSGVMFGTSGTMWAYAKGINTAFCDGHVKFRRVGAQWRVGASPDGSPFTDFRVDPFTGYDQNGIPGWYWYDGCFAWLFRPDYIP